MKDGFSPELHKPAKTRLDTQTKITAKLAVLREWEREGLPERAYLPTSERQFRLWADDKLGLKMWASPNVLNEEWNSEHKAEAKRLISVLRARLRERVKRTGSRREQLEAFRRRIDELERREALLASQYTVARDAAERAERQLVTARRTISDLETRLREHERIPRIGR